jgi:tryptophan synthase alpha chain
MSNLNRYAEKFAQLKKVGSKAFIPFTMLGYPNRNTCLETMKTFVDSGASALELGLAFSDPMADGPTIQQAANETIATGFSVDDAFSLIADIRQYNADIPIGLLVYYNMILKCGPAMFYEKAGKSGVDGILIADLPAECADEVADHATKNNIDQIFIVSTLTNKKRLKDILKHAGGFLYAVSRIGITGVEERYDAQLKDLIDRVREQSKLPVCIGFGISTPEQAKTMCELGADGVITGSKIISIINENRNCSDAATLSQFLKTMVAAVSIEQCQSAESP